MRPAYTVQVQAPHASESHVTKKITHKGRNSALPVTWLLGSLVYCAQTIKLGTISLTLIVGVSFPSRVGMKKERW